MAKRIARLLASIALIVGSLLTFPAGVPTMIALWLAVHTALAWQGRAGWLPLAGCAVVIVVKRFDWPPGLWLLLAAMIVVGLLGRQVRHMSALPQRRLTWVMTSLLWLAWLEMAWEWHRDTHADHSVAPLDGRPVVCLGDSLTRNPPGGDYPAALAKLLTVPVVNLGRPGITSQKALALLPDLEKKRPQVVVIELGGNDFINDDSAIKTDSRAALKQNLERFILAARELRAEIVLFEVPRGFITDPYAGLERELAREYDLELVADTAVRNLVLYSPSGPIGVWTGGPYLSDDGLHPNARGDAYLAKRVAERLAGMYGRRILRP
ncbi:MAG TPA: GDSL-type esterase/lipase family protein [Pirellulales bacterium]|nr:GDSL-type esterase/lipase family protein [Pirellulales bacterium]